MISYNLLPLELLEEVFKRVQAHVPDGLRDPRAFYAFCASQGTVLFEVGDFGGVFWLANAVVGKRATIHVVLWDPDCLGKPQRAAQIVRDVFNMWKLRRLDAFVPATNLRACKYAARVGFQLEGILRKADTYDGKTTDIAVYSLTKEEVL